MTVGAVADRGTPHEQGTQTFQSVRAAELYSFDRAVWAVTEVAD
jgi:hypothetical protein